MLAFARTLALGVDTIEFDDRLIRIERDTLALAREFLLHPDRLSSDSVAALNFQGMAVHAWNERNLCCGGKNSFLRDSAH